MIAVDRRSATIILGVEDNPDDLGDLERELSKRYGQDYAVVCEVSPSQALGTLGRLRDQERPVALVLAAQWMAEMEGVEFLRRVHELHPTAKRASPLDSLGRQTFGRTDSPGNVAGSSGT